MTVLRSGSNKQYAENWDHIFGGKKATKKSAKKKKPAKKSASKKSKKR